MSSSSRKIRPSSSSSLRPRIKFIMNPKLNPSNPNSTPTKGLKRLVKRLPLTPNPYTPPTLTTANKSKKVYSEKVVGMKIRVFWDLDNTWHQARIKSYDTSLGKHLILYEDDDYDDEEELLDLHTHRFEFLEVKLEKKDHQVGSKKRASRGRPRKYVKLENYEGDKFNNYEKSGEDTVVKIEKLNSCEEEKKGEEEVVKIEKLNSYEENREKEVVKRGRGRPKKNLSNGEKRGSLSPVSKSIKDIVSLINNTRGQDADTSRTSSISDAAERLRKNEAETLNLFRATEANHSSTSGQVPSSQPPQSTGGNKPKTIITVDLSGRLVGDLSQTFSTRAGEFIRMYCPLNYADWRLVPKNFKDNVWNSLMSEFEFDAPSDTVRPLVELTFPQKFRSHKCLLRKEYLKDVASKEAAESLCPAGYNLDAWKAFVAHESEDKVKKRNAKNAESKSKNTICHTLGRRSYANKKYILEKEGIVIEGRPGSWMKGHERKDGSVHPSALEKYEQVKAAHEKRKNPSEEGFTNKVNIDSDAVTDVFGPEKGTGYVRAYSSHVSTKRVKQASFASYLVDKRVDNYKSSLEAKVDKIANQLEEWSSLIKGMTQATGRDGIASPKILSNSVPCTSQMNSSSLINGDVRDNVDADSRVRAKSYVNLLNRDGKVVATGYIVTGKNGEICHDRKVLLGEKKIRIEDVMDVSAAVPDPPQGHGHFTLAGFVEGGSLIWAESRLQLIS